MFGAFEGSQPVLAQPLSALLYPAHATAMATYRNLGHEASDSLGPDILQVEIFGLLGGMAELLLHLGRDLVRLVRVCHLDCWAIDMIVLFLRGVLKVRWLLRLGLRRLWGEGPLDIWVVRH